ncbi:MAG: glycosyl hydrolase 115 family protein, partial [Kiritimatiellaceae bacterium]|nr:glycosyl hydrolase 115 family protein [Kiritimatiellaceae bacterium]
MDLAWDVDRWNPEKSHTYLKHWSAETFGDETSDDIAEVLSEFYRLSASGKPEHVYRLEYTLNEVTQRIETFKALSNRVDAIAKRLPNRLQDAFLHLISYPVKGSCLKNERILTGRLSQLHAANGEKEKALAAVAYTKVASKALDTLTDAYNNAGNNKWNHFMRWNSRWEKGNLRVAPPELIEETTPSLSAKTFSLKDARLEGGTVFTDDQLVGNSSTSTATFTWNSDEAGSTYLWIRSTKPTGRKFRQRKRVNSQLDGSINGTEWKHKMGGDGSSWHTAISPPRWHKVSKVDIKKGKNTFTVKLVDPLTKVSDIQLSRIRPFADEPLQVISAGSFKAKGEGSFSKIATFTGLGTGIGVGSLPFTAPSLDATEVDKAPWIEYDVAITPESKRLWIRTLPNQRIHEGRGVAYAVSIDGGAPRVFDVHADEFSSEWQFNVIHGYTSRYIELDATADKTIKVRIYILDPGLVMRELLVTDN